MSEQGVVVTIDGPSGSGKSTISRLLADRLGFTYLDTGAMYRAVGLKVVRAGLDVDHPEAQAQLAEIVRSLDIRLAPAPAADQETRVFVDGEDVSSAIRTPEMSMVASRVSAEKVVRARLTELQKEIGARGAIVAEGRDMGTVVFPRAQYKFFLSASPEERARRRVEQLSARGQLVDPEEILAQIVKRDQDDSVRALAPLKPANDAVIVDSSAMGIDAVLAFMADRVQGNAGP